VARAGISDADRFLAEAVDSAPDDPARRVNLTQLAEEEGFGGAAASARAWERAGYGARVAPRAGPDAASLVFGFSEDGYVRARAEADRLCAVQADYRRRQWRWPETEVIAKILAGICFAFMLVYYLLGGD
jgi:hypothetical protein